MKLSHFTAILKNELYIIWPFLFIAPFYAYLSINENGSEQVFELKPLGPGVMLFFVPLLAYNFLFQNGYYGFKPAYAPSFGNLEFMFTRAIDRISLFFVKSCLYLILCSMPLVVIWTYSYTAPTVRVQLPYSAHEHREEAKQFYLSHFEGAHLQEPDMGNNKDYVVLPQVRINQAVYAFLSTFGAVLLYQVVLLAFPKIQWMPIVTLFALAIFLSLGTYSFKPPTLYEMGLAWVVQHTLLAFLGLGLFTLLAQIYCCRRFINTEITS